MLLYTPSEIDQIQQEGSLHLPYEYAVAKSK